MEKNNIKERLQSLVRVPGYMSALTENISITIHKYNELLELKRIRIESIMEDYYTPLGLWNQNPTTTKRDFGVIINNKWSPINQTNTSYRGHVLIFNKCNLYLLENKRDQIVFDDRCCTIENFSRTKDKINKILDVLEEIKSDIFNPDCEMFKMLIEMHIKNMGLGDKGQEYCIKYLSHFFSDIIDIKSSFGLGDYDDRKTGIDITVFRQNNVQSKLQVKVISNDIIETDEYYNISVTISKNSICDYYFFIDLNNNRIISIKNDKTLIKPIEGIFPKSLLLKDLSF